MTRGRSHSTASPWVSFCQWCVYYGSLVHCLYETQTFEGLQRLHTREYGHRVPRCGRTIDRRTDYSRWPWLPSNSSNNSIRRNIPPYVVPSHRHSSISWSVSIHHNSYTLQSPPSSGFSRVSTRFCSDSFPNCMGRSPNSKPLRNRLRGTTINHIAELRPPGDAAAAACIRLVHHYAIVLHRFVYPILGRLDC
jgi:hypothetical protein